MVVTDFFLPREESSRTRTGSPLDAFFFFGGAAAAAAAGGASAAPAAAAAAAAPEVDDAVAAPAASPSGVLAAGPSPMFREATASAAASPPAWAAFHLFFFFFFERRAVIRGGRSKRKRVEQSMDQRTLSASCRPPLSVFQAPSRLPLVLITIAGKVLVELGRDSRDRVVLDGERRRGRGALDNCLGGIGDGSGHRCCCCLLRARAAAISVQIVGERREGCRGEIEIEMQGARRTHKDPIEQASLW